MDQSNKNNIDEELHNLIKLSVSSNFTPLFAERVITKLINDQSAFDQMLEQLFIPFRRMVFPIIVILLFLISYNIIDEGKVTLASALDIPEVSLQDAIDPINSLEWSE